MLKVIPLKEEHLEDAARLVCNRYKRLWEQEPRLPHSYTEATKFLPLLREILNKSGVGVVAIQGDRLVGFLTGWLMSSFRGKRSAYSPEWANAAVLEDSKFIYGEMYTNLSRAWVADKYVAHYVSLFPNDVDALGAWHWMGFGMIAVDAIRGLDSIPGYDDVNVHIRRAGQQDIEQVMQLREALWQYEKEAPIFYLAEKKTRGYYEEWLQNPKKVAWLAFCNEEPVALMKLGPADGDVATIIFDEKTTSIYSAFTKKEMRRKGVATALLNRAVKWAQASGYERCALSFEPMNPLATCIWLKYFKPVCLSLVRYIDDRVMNV